MIIHSIRRVTNDARHNAFTGCCWFKDNLYVAYRQGDAHACKFGRLVVLRSRDRGLSWDHVAVLRGPGDTRDAHLYTDGRRLFAVGFCYEGPPGEAEFEYYSGCASSADGDIWTSWKRYDGTDRYVMWRPQFFRDTHYCAGYCFATGVSGKKQKREVAWFESRDGRCWKYARPVHHGPDEPNECYLELRDDRATMLMRCEGGARHPFLCSSEYPFKKWTLRRLEHISIGGPCLWTAGNDVYISARWYVPVRRQVRGDVAHTAIFKLVNGKPELQLVLPSGPRFDHSYMAAARHPDNDRRFMLSFYSDAVAPADPTVAQWSHTDIYLADVVCEAEYLRDGFLVSKLMPLGEGLETVRCPSTSDASMKFVKLKTGAAFRTPDFLDVSRVIERKPGIIYILRDIRTGDAEKVRLHIGYDGPVKVWWNGDEMFTGAGANPAIKDQTTMAAACRGAVNRLAIALDTNGGKAQGIFVRWEPAG